MNTNTATFKTLSETNLLHNYENAFSEATGLPVSLASKDAWQLPLHGKSHENPFCAMLARSKSCAGCLQMKETLSRHNEDTPCIKTCPFRLIEAAVPVRVSGEVSGFLVTGQVMEKKPTEAQFEAVFKKLDASIDKKKAHDAYFATPVVSKRTLKSAIHLLSIFADHLTIKSNQLVTQTTHTEPLVVTKARQYISEHTDEEATLDKTARASGASTFYLCKLFRRHLGMTFTEYVSRYRVERAKEMLQKPNIRVSEVAFEAGFQSLTHFNRIFRKIVGGSPTEYRSQLALS